MQEADEKFERTASEMRELAFNAVIGLATKQGGAVLLGDTAQLAADTYRRSLIGTSFPSFWMEAPLAGDPGFDLHVYYDRGQVSPHDRFEEGCGFGMQPLFDWYFGSDIGGVGIGFAHDLRGAEDVTEVATGAYVNFSNKPLADERGFFRALGSEESHAYVDAQLKRLPHKWNPWYLGLFPQRVPPSVRVGSFVTRARQAEYVQNPRLLADDLAQAGFTALSSEMLDQLVALAALPYQLELQLDVTAEGTGTPLGADLTLGFTSADNVKKAFDEGPAARACRHLQEWGMADDRWRSVGPAALSYLVPLSVGGRTVGCLLACLPSFIKAKWVNACPQPAKVYLNCDAHLVSLNELKRLASQGPSKR